VGLVPVLRTLEGFLERAEQRNEIASNSREAYQQSALWAVCALLLLKGLDRQECRLQARAERRRRLAGLQRARNGSEGPFDLVGELSQCRSQGVARASRDTAPGG
jgi:hypothetical protein